MHIKLLISAAAIALVAGLGTATAEEPFTYLEGVRVDKLTVEQMAGVTGEGQTTQALVILKQSDANGLSGGEALNGILVAAGPGPAGGVDIYIIFDQSPSP